MLGVKAATWSQVVLRGPHFYEGHAAAGGHTVLMACVPPGDHGDIRAPDATMHSYGPTTVRVCIDVYGPCCPQRPNIVQGLDHNQWL